MDKIKFQLLYDVQVYFYVNSEQTASRNCRDIQTKQFLYYAGKLQMIILHIGHEKYDRNE